MILATVSGLGGIATATLVNVTWIGGSGNWNTAGNWIPGQVPNNGGDTYIVRIDNEGGTNSVVTLNTIVTVDQLTVDVNDILNFNNGQDMTIAVSGITNNGAINLNSSGSLTDFILFGSVTLGGSGEVVMSNQSNNRIFTNNATLMQAATHTIQGAGQLLVNTGGMVNLGTIIADKATALTIDPNALGFTNQGTMQATGAGGFVFNAGTFTNTGETIEVLTGSKLDLTGGATVIGGTLSTTGTGVINVKGSSTDLELNNVTIASTVNQGDGFDAEINGALTNNGTWNMNSVGSLTDLTFAGGITLDGNGEVVMGNHFNNRIFTNGTTLTQAATHTIQGAGQLLVNSGGMVNQGAIIADQATALTIDPNALGFTNQGTMQATGAGGFVFNAGTFTNTDQTIEVLTGSKLDLTGGVTVVGGTLSTTGTGVINAKGSSTDLELNNVTIASTVNQGDGFDAEINGGLTNNGTWNMNSVGSLTDLTFAGGITLGGTGEVVMGNHFNNRIFTNNTTLTQGANHTIQGAGQLLVNSGGMVNQGAIIADQATAITIDPNALGFTNQGTMQATGAGGFVFNAGTFTNTGQTIEVLTGSKLDLNQSVTVVGGTLSTTGTGVINVKGSSTDLELNNVTIASTVNQANSFDAEINGGLTNNGTWNMNSTGGNTDLTFAGGITLGGNGEVVMSDQSKNRFLTNNTTLTQAANHTIKGAGQLLVNTGGMVNQGTIIADQATAITIDPNGLGFTNQGTMQATGAGGFVFNPGTFTNTGQTIEVLTGSKLDLNGGATVVGGTLSTTGTGVINVKGSSTDLELNDVTIASTVNQGDGFDAEINVGLTNNGTWNMNSTGGNTDLTFAGGITLGGNGEVVMSDQSKNRFLTNNTTLTQAANHTIKGAGQLLVNTGGMVNQGTIIADQATAITIDPNGLGFTNQGTMQATGSGGINIIQTGSTFTTSGTVAVGNGSQVNVTGTYTQTGGTTTLDGTLDPTGTVQLQAGTLNGSGTVASDLSSDATISPGSSAGKLTIDGNLTLTDSSILFFEIGGNIQSQEYDFLDVAGTVALDGTLNFDFFDGAEFILSDSDTLTVLSGSTITGTLFDIDSGDRIDSTNGKGSFLINFGVGSPFDDNSIVFSNFMIIPEPANFAFLLCFIAAAAVALVRSQRKGR